MDSTGPSLKNENASLAPEAEVMNIPLYDMFLNPNQSMCMTFLQNSFSKRHAGLPFCPCKNLSYL
jgi:hypothetical protein